MAYPVLHSEKGDDRKRQRQEGISKMQEGNFQRFQQRKQAVRGWSVEKKLEKLAIYSSCKEDASCKCNGWKNPNLSENPTGLAVPIVAPPDPCEDCGHAFSSHVSQLVTLNTRHKSNFLVDVTSFEYKCPR